MLQEIPIDYFIDLESNVDSFGKSMLIKGLQEGREEGLAEGLKAFAQYLLDQGHKPKEVAKQTGLELSDVLQLRSEKLS